eukprot:117459-Pyramimonas_sp.AAC.1
MVQWRVVPRSTLATSRVPWASWAPTAFAMEGATCPHQTSTDVLGFQGWVPRGRFLVVDLLRHERKIGKSRDPMS